MLRKCQKIYILVQIAQKFHKKPQCGVKFARLRGIRNSSIVKTELCFITEIETD